MYTLDNVTSRIRCTNYTKVCMKEQKKNFGQKSLKVQHLDVKTTARMAFCQGNHDSNVPEVNYKTF